ncbi:MAG TPA: gliding motility-associated C-terminal domain-containing protein, partial [Bacteroidia bacterium]
TYVHPAIVNSPVQFQDSSVNTSGWNWNFGNTYTDTHSNPQSIYTSLGTYPVTLIVHDSLGCLDTIVKYIVIDGAISVPNIFTPNGDGANDVFLLKDLGLNEYTIEIVDRWGLVVYNGDQNTSAWDGRTPAGLACPAGTYFYLINGTAVTTPKEYKGFLTLIR